MASVKQKLVAFVKQESKVSLAGVLRLSAFSAVLVCMTIWLTLNALGLLNHAY